MNGRDAANSISAIAENRFSLPHSCITFNSFFFNITWYLFFFTVRSPSSPATLRCRNDPSSPRGINKVHFICICWSFWVTLISAECRRRRLLSTVRKEGERTSFHWRLDLGGEKIGCYRYWCISPIISVCKIVADWIWKSVSIFMQVRILWTSADVPIELNWKRLMEVNWLVFVFFQRE